MRGEGRSFRTHAGYWRVSAWWLTVNRGSGKLGRRRRILLPDPKEQRRSHRSVAPANPCDTLCDWGLAPAVNVNRDVGSSSERLTLDSSPRKPWLVCRMCFNFT
jgi:hypothetical protein